MENLNYFDIIVSALILFLGLKGLLRGFIKEAFALFGIIGGVFIASRIAYDTGNAIDAIIPMSNNNTVLLVGFFISLIAIWAVAYALGMIVSKMFSLSGLGIFDRVLGFIFGAGKVFLLFSIIAYSIVQIETFKEKLDEKLHDSFMLPILVETGNVLIKLDSQELQNKVSNTVDSVVETTQETMNDMTNEAVLEKIEEIKKDVVDGKQ